MIIYQREPVFTIGQAPFLAGTIHVRNQMRALKQREKARRRQALADRFALLRVKLPRYKAIRRSLAPSFRRRVFGRIGARTAAADSAATANA